MDWYIVKKWGHSYHIVLNKKLYNPGEKICVSTENDQINLDLLITDLLELKKRVSSLEDKYENK